jgi:hypothetical protein
MSASEAHDYPPPPLDDELETEILPVRRRRRLPLLTAVLVLALVAGGAFVGGVGAQKHWGGSSSATGNGSSFAGRFGGAAGAANRANGAAGFTLGGAGVTAGTVSLIKGKTLYVTDAGGNTVKVTTAGSRVTKTVSSSLAGIRPGDAIVVRGAQQKNGSIAAQSISVGGAGALGAGGATGFGGNGGATGFGGSGKGSNDTGGATGFGG